MPQFAEVDLDVEHRGDGSAVLRNRIPLLPSSETLPERLRHWAHFTPENVFLTENLGNTRRSISYGEAHSRIRYWAERLLSQPVSSQVPLMVVAGNNINHALMMLAATSVNIPVAIVSPNYISSTATPQKFIRILQQISPGLVVADDPLLVSEVVRASGLNIPVRPLHDLDWMDSARAVGNKELAEAEHSVGPDSPAKLLFTSGSTGTPKAVINTQRMMVSNMQALGLVWPFLRQRPPVLVDWLPWNHTFGGNCCFNLSLYYGGTFHIDDGKPVPGLVGKTIDAIREIQPTIYFNVPIGYEALLPLLEADPSLAKRFLSGVDFLFNAAAAMPTSLRQRIEELSRNLTGSIPLIVGGWGSTETAPFSTVVYFKTSHAANLGVPIPGTEIKLTPSGGRSELSVRGPNVTPGYWGQPDATKAAFDPEGFYKIGDNGKLADPDRPEAGILFDGRAAENFKLLSGTWVNVGALRLLAIAAAKPLIKDVVVAGEGRDEIGLLIFADEKACRQAIGDKHHDLESAVTHPDIVKRLAFAFRVHNESAGGSSVRIARFSILREPPQHQFDEITEKGYLNQQAILRRRIKEVISLYSDGHNVR